MLKNRTYAHRSRLLFVGLALLIACPVLTSGEQTTTKKKLKIVLLMGQSNMVGYSRPGTAWYLTQPRYVPPPKTAKAKGRTYEEGGFYWAGVNYAYGDSEAYNARGPALLAERHASRRLWRARVYGNTHGTRNDWNEKKWGPMPKTGTKTMYPFLEKKAEEEGIYTRMAAYIDSPENKFPPKVALAELAKRDEPIADDIKRVREIFLKGTKPKDFDGLDAAIEPLGRIAPSNRLAYADAVRKQVNLPIAKHTYITAYGEVSGEPTDVESDNVTRGLLSLGYTKWPDACGPEYPFGISFEQRVDGPVLLIKCAWGGTSLHGAWRPPSLANAETPIEKATREAANKAGAEAAKKGGYPFTPKEPQTGTGRLFEASLAHIRKVLADPGKYDPDYDQKAGYELAGLIWFQGWNDSGNKAYGEQLVHFIKDWRKELNAPDMPVVCGLLGHRGWKRLTFGGDVNSGMLYAASRPDLKGTVDIVNTLKYMPIELGMLDSVKMAYGADSSEYKKAERIIKRATSKDGTHYFGSAKFLYLTGDAMARELANLMAGGEPMIFKEAEEILGGQ